MQNTIIDKLITDTNYWFKQYVWAYTSVEFGQQSLDAFSDAVCVDTINGLNINVEPIPMRELKVYRMGFQSSLLELYHGKMVQSWNDCLSEIFKMLLELHFSKRRPFKELKRCEVGIDFQDSDSFDYQIENSLCTDFDFRKYKERVKLINGVLNPNGEQEDHFQNISKNIYIRNQIQHHGSEVKENIKKELGCEKLSVLAHDGKVKEYNIGEKVELSVVEFDSFHQSLLILGQAWRKWNEKY